MKTKISSQRTSLSFDYENQRKLMKEERFAGKQNSAGEMGHRIAKHVYTSANVLEKSTYYVLDAQGNTMATYERAVDENTLQISYAQTEKFIYGSSRLGVQNCNIALLGSQNNSYTQTTVAHRIGKKGYELSNHLGNVLSVISDKVIPHNNGGNVDYYMADIRQAQDYSPFGVILSGRNFNKNGNQNLSRYGFNGMEADDELKGDGNSYDFGARMLDPRLGRWLTIDPMFRQYESLAAFCFSSNNPIYLKDANGKVIVDPNGEIVFVKLGVTKFEHPGAPGKSAEVEFGVIFGNDGTPILVYRDVEGKIAGANTDCHGVTFAQGKFWINNDQVPALLKADGYIEQNYEDRKWGDPVIYVNENGEVEDSKTICKDHDQVYGQGGLETKNTKKHIDKAWKSNGKVLARIFHNNGDVTYNEEQIKTLKNTVLSDPQKTIEKVTKRDSKLEKSKKTTHVVPAN